MTLKLLHGVAPNIGLAPNIIQAPGLQPDIAEKDLETLKGYCCWDREQGFEDKVAVQWA